MRFYLVVALGALSVAACGSSSNPGPTGMAGSSGSAGSLGATGGVGGSTGGSGGSSGVGNQNCNWLASCISSSSCSDQACIAGCAAQASSTAINQYAALIDCINANPQCTTTDCLAIVCSGEVAACNDTSVAPVDGGQTVASDAGVPQVDVGPVPVADAGPDLPKDTQGPDTPLVIDVSRSTDAGVDGAGAGQGYMTSGSCDIVFTIPNLVDSHTCWDYTMTVTTNHNDGIEHYFAYGATDVSGTQSACTSQSNSGSQPGPWDSAAISASNLSHKKQACDLSGSSGATSIWTEGGTCSPAGSLGHCTDAATNAWDPATQVLSSSLVGVWSVP